MNQVEIRFQCELRLQSIMLVMEKGLRHFCRSSQFLTMLGAYVAFLLSVEAKAVNATVFEPWLTRAVQQGQIQRLQYRQDAEGAPLKLKPAKTNCADLMSSPQKPQQAQATGPQIEQSIKKLLAAAVTNPDKLWIHRFGEAWAKEEKDSESREQIRSAALMKLAAIRNKWENNEMPNDSLKLWAFLVLTDHRSDGESDEPLVLSDLLSRVESKSGSGSSGTHFMGEINQKKQPIYASDFIPFAAAMTNLMQKYNVGFEMAEKETQFLLKTLNLISKIEPDVKDTLGLGTDPYSDVISDLTESKKEFSKRKNAEIPEETIISMAELYVNTIALLTDREWSTLMMEKMGHVPSVPTGLEPLHVRLARKLVAWAKAKPYLLKQQFLKDAFNNIPYFSDIRSHFDFVEAEGFLRGFPIFMSPPAQTCCH